MLQDEWQYHSAESEGALALMLFHLDRQEEASTLLQYALRILSEQVPDYPILQQLRELVQGDPG